MENTVSDQMVIKWIVNKENELFVAQECRDIVESLEKQYSSAHTHVLEKAIDDYESKLINEIQSLEDMVENSVHKSWVT